MLPRSKSKKLKTNILDECSDGHEDKDGNRLEDISWLKTKMLTILKRIY